ncbi:MAG TPA: lipopolysaccharide kinase InaA family protein [Methylophilus sp.]|uniref:lipopolysaccharide kinase InaA family protein n=1 Tax=Methylophilus sp. TaxID=29541 RepID=UPI002BB276DD|nr:lipopolysaccharide kinase InaA family protein [Methylophilus sp.]HSH86524.1 lipopolysaccharide kinase InaA family protein [Methylophilus sp.]
MPDLEPIIQTHNASISMPIACPVVTGEQLALPDGSALTQLQVHRMLPGRRWVFSAAWQNQAVFAKVFIGRQAEKYAKRDAQGAIWMAEAALKTPALLWQGHAKNGQAHVLIYAAIPQAENVHQVYAQTEVPQRLMLLEKVVQVLAQQHAAGLLQTDLHLKNFMLANGSVWSIDGDGIRKKTLSRRACYQQLAALIAKLSILDQQAWVPDLLGAYQQQRKWSGQISQNQILAWAKHYKAQEVREYVERKIFRNCTDVIWQQTATFVMAHNAHVALPELTPDALELAMRAGSMLKEGNTSTVVRTRLAQLDAVIKRYNIKNMLHAIGRSWRPSRAAVSWSNAHRLQYHEILTPQPLAMLEKRLFGLRGQAYFVSAVSALPDAFTFFNTISDEALRSEALRQLALTCYQFYLLQISHGDMKATNLQINAQGQIVVMDLDSMQQHRCAKRALRAHVKDIRRLLQNWKDDTSLYNALLQSFHAVYVDHMPLKLAGISI